MPFYRQLESILKSLDDVNELKTREQLYLTGEITSRLNKAKDEIDRVVRDFNVSLSSNRLPS